MRASFVSRTGLIAHLLCSITTTFATATFQNKGTKDLVSAVGEFSGWDGFNHEAHGTVEESTTVYFEGPTSLKMIQTYDANYHDRYHSEAIHRDAYTVGDTGFYGFAFRLHSNWDTTSTTPKTTYNIAQFIADFSSDPGNTCGEGWLPSMMMWVEGNKLRARRKGNNVCAPWTPDYDYEEYDVGTVVPGQWHVIVIQASWKSDETGYFKVWMDGTKTVQEFDIITTYKDAAKARHFQFSVGLYANSWHDVTNPPVPQAERQLWIDEVGMGSEFKDADPNQW